MDPNANRTAAVTVGLASEEVERRFKTAVDVPDGAAVAFRPAPGDRGTEIHVTVPSRSVLGKFVNGDPLAKTKDQLRRFKQEVETGVVLRSDATPEGESLLAKLKQRPGQPVEA